MSEVQWVMLVLRGKTSDPNRTVCIPFLTKDLLNKGNKRVSMNKTNHL
jgi:hypothetical protein